MDYDMYAYKYGQAQNKMFEINSNIFRQRNLLQEITKPTDFSATAVRVKAVEDAASDIYWYSENPKEEDNARKLASFVHSYNPHISEEDAYNNYRDIIKQVVGDDMDATSVFELFDRKVRSGLANLAFGVSHLGWMIANPVADEEERNKETERLTKLQHGYFRTDIYNDQFENFIDKCILSVADFLPSNAVSMAGSWGGYILSYLTGNPLFALGGNILSTLSAGLMEGGSAAMEAQLAGADVETQFDIFNVVGTINGSLEILGNMGERRVAEAVGEAIGLRKALKDTGKVIVNKTLKDIFVNGAIDYGVDLFLEPVTEVAQEFTSMYVANLAAEWEKENLGKEWNDKFTYTPQEMADAMWETAKSTFRGQLLMGAAGQVKELGSSFLGGEARLILNADKYTERSDNSVVVNANSVLSKNGGAKLPIVETKDKKGNTVKTNGKWSPIKVYETIFGFVPINGEEAAKAAFIKNENKGKNGKASSFSAMSVEIVDSKLDGTDSDKKLSRYLAAFINGKDKNNENIAIAVDDNGVVQTDAKDLSQVVQEFIGAHYDTFKGVETSSVDGVNTYKVQLNDKVITFTDKRSESAENITTIGILNDLKEQKYTGDEASKRKQFMADVETELKKQGYAGESLDSAKADMEELIDKWTISVDSLFEQRKAEGVDAYSDELNTETKYGTAAMVTKFLPIVGRDMKWAKDHVVIDDKLRSSSGGYTGTSYWTDASGQHFLNYSEIENKDDAVFHIAISALVDDTTGIHEVGHMALSMGEQKFLKDKSFISAFQDELKEDNKIVHDDGTVEYKPESEWVIGDTTHEAFAEKLERYVESGIVENKEQASLFRRIINAIRALFEPIREFLTDKQIEFYDKLFEADNRNSYSNVETASTENTTEESESAGNKVQVDMPDLPEGEEKAERHKQFALYDMPPIDRDEIYANFKDSYDKATGSSWDSDYFDYKAKSWTFWGTPQGGIAMRRQNSGLWKMNASYGSTKEIYKGFREMLGDVGLEPIWGAMTENIADMVVKASGRYGADTNFSRVPKMMVMMLYPTIRKTMHGDVQLQQDGTLLAHTPAGVPMTKVLVANKAYYEQMIDRIENNPSSLGVPSMLQQSLLSYMKDFYDSTFNQQQQDQSQQSTERHKQAIDYLNENRWNYHRIVFSEPYMRVALKRDKLYINSIVKDIESIFGNKYTVGNGMNFYYFYNDLPASTSDWNDDDIIDFSRINHEQPIIDLDFDSDVKVDYSDYKKLEEYLDQDIAGFRYSADYNAFEVPLRNGFTLRVSKPDVVLTIHQDGSTRPQRSYLHENVVDSFMDVERNYWGNLKRISGHHSHVAFRQLEKKYIGNGAGSQVYGPYHYLATEEGVNSGYRDQFFYKAEQEINRKQSEEETHVVDLLMSKVDNILSEYNKKITQALGSVEDFYTRGEGNVLKNTPVDVLLSSADIRGVVEEHVAQGITDEIEIDRSFMLPANGFYPEDYGGKYLAMTELSDALIDFCMDTIYTNYTIDDYERIKDELTRQDGFAEITSLFLTQLYEIFSDAADKLLNGEGVYNAVVQRRSEIYLTDIINDLTFYHDVTTVNTQKKVIQIAQKMKELAVETYKKVDPSIESIKRVSSDFDGFVSYFKSAISPIAGNHTYLMSTFWKYVVQRKTEEHNEKIRTKYNLVKFDQSDDTVYGVPYRIVVLSKQDMEDGYNRLQNTYNEKPTVKFYVVETEGDDEKYLKWDEPIPSNWADKIWNEAVKLGLDKFITQDKVYRLPLKILFDEMADAFASLDPNIYLYKGDYKYRKKQGMLNDNQTRADYAVADLLYSVGLQGHAVPNNYTMGRGANREYDTPNYVMYADEATNVIARQSFSYDSSLYAGGYHLEEETRFGRGETERYKTAPDIDMFKEAMRKGQIPSWYELRRYRGKTDWVDAEEIAQKTVVDGSLNWIGKLLDNIVYEYKNGNKFSWDDITDSDWEKITQAFIRRAKDKQKIDFNGVDVTKVLQRIFAWDIHRDESARLRVWEHQYTGSDSDAGKKKNILQLARKLYQRGEFRDRGRFTDILGKEQVASKKYRFLDLVQQMAYGSDGMIENPDGTFTQKSSAKNYRTTRVASAIWEGARQEIVANAAELMAIDQSVALTDDGMQIEQTGIEDSDISLAYSNATEKDVRKARDAQAKAEYRVRQLEDELEDAEADKEILAESIRDQLDALQKVSADLGIDPSQYTTILDLIHAIHEVSADIQETADGIKLFTEQQAKEFDEKLSKADDKIRLLKNDLLLERRESKGLEVQLRQKNKRIAFLAKKIDDESKKLKDAKSSLADTEAKRKTLKKQFEDVVKKLQKSNAKQSKLDADITTLTDAIRNAWNRVDDYKSTNKILSKENNELKAKSDTDEAVIQRLGEIVRELDGELRDKEKIKAKKERAEQQLQDMKARRLIAVTRNNVHNLLEKKTGDPTVDKALATFSKMLFSREDEDGNFVAKEIPSAVLDVLNRKFTINNNETSIMDFLKKNNMIEGNTLVKGFADIKTSEYKELKSVITGARESSDEMKQKRDEAKAAVITDFAKQIIDGMGGLNLNKKEQEEANRRFMSKEFNSIEEAELAVYAEKSATWHEGTNVQKKRKGKIGFNERKGMNLNNNIAFNSFTSLWNMLYSISPKLQELFFFGNGDMIGINQVYDAYIKAKNERYDFVKQEVIKALGGEGLSERKQEKLYNDFLKKSQKTVETKELNPSEGITEWLDAQQTFQNFLGTQTYRPDFVDNDLTLENAMAIYEHAKQNEDIAHILNEQSNVSALQMAWIVKQFEEEDGVFHQYKAIADAYQKGYEYSWEKFQQVANDVYGLALTRYQYYSPSNGASDSKDTDISLAFNFSYEGTPENYKKSMAMGVRSDMREKLGGNNPIKLNYISDFRGIVDSQEFFIAGADFFDTWNDIMKNDGGAIRQAIDARGSGASFTIMKLMKSISNPSYEDVANGMNRYVNMIRNNLALANLGFSLSSTLQQPAVLFLGAGKFGVKYMVDAFKAIHAHGGVKEFIKYVHGLSPQIKENADLNLMYAKQAIEDSKFLNALGIGKEIATFGMKGIEGLDQISRCIMFEAGFQYYTTKKGLSKEEAQVRSTQDVLNMNSSRQAKDNAILYNTKSPFWKSLLLFTNQLNKQWNMLIGQDGIGALLEKNYKQFIGTCLGMAFASSWVLLAKGRLLHNADKDDEDWLKDLLKDFAVEGVEVIPLIGDKISEVVNGYTYMDSNIVTSTTKFFTELAKKKDADNPKKWQKVQTAGKNAVIDAMTLAGQPKNITKNTYNALFENGKYVGDEFFDGRWLRTFLPYEWYLYFTEGK